MTEVSRDEFFRRVFEGKLDVHPSIISSFPYTAIWKFPRNPGQAPFGKSVDRVEGGRILTSYFVSRA